MEAVKIVTIKEKLPLYTKKGEEAERIELLKFKENEFQIVSQKNLYKIGSKALYIKPDYCVPDNALFSEFVKPNGNYSKSYLGLIEGIPSRIRAKEFNMTLKNSTETIYSNGILLPIEEVEVYLLKKDIITLEPKELQEALKITKYTPPEETFRFNGVKEFPEGLYKTDEKDYRDIINNIKFPLKLVLKEKIDGSSITIGITDVYPEGFICSRNLNLPITKKVVTGKRNKTLLEYLMFWKKVDTNLYTKVINKDNLFIKAGYPYLEKLFTLKKKNIILRGELNGSKCKGSGNKLNPYAGQPLNIKFFGVDIVDSRHISSKADNDTFMKISEELELPLTPIITTKIFKSKEDLIKYCGSYFNKMKRKYNMTPEGIVARSLDSSISFKVINDEYDSKK